MNTGGLSPILLKKLPRFNGGLFAKADAIELNAEQIQLLIEAATANWRDVEPAIFGTLLERALDPRERHKLGAHYTPRAYVERLVNPTVIEPLREQWKAVQVAALQLAEDGKWGGV
jgi:type II restriction/modification system DNA methylase subunit YeeA